MILTVERVLSSSSEKTQFFDAPEMSAPPPSDSGKAPSSQRVPVPTLITGNGTPKGETGAQIQQDTASPPTDRGTPPLRTLPAHAGSRDEDTSTPFAGGIGSGHGASTSFARRGSAHTTKSTRSLTEATAAFRRGSALTGPDAEPEVDEDVIRRGAIAERSLSTKQRNKIAKGEQQDSKDLSKILQEDSKLEKDAFHSALKSLAALQDLHKAACKREGKAEIAYRKSLLSVQEAESIYHETKASAEERWARWEGKQAEVRAQEERLEAERETVRKTENRIRDCAREVESLRLTKGSDERVKEVKKMELSGKKK